MPLTPRTSNRRPATVRSRSRRSHAAATRVAASLAGPVAATVDAQRAGGPQDLAFYACACGCDFRAAVSTTVGCPACGAPQDW